MTLSDNTYSLSLKLFRSPSRELLLSRERLCSFLDAKSNVEASIPYLMLHVLLENLRLIRASYIPQVSLEYVI
jgi:hypothetical protein